QVRGAAADVEVEYAQIRIGARQLGATPHERQPRLEARIIGGGDQGVAEPLANEANERRGIVALCGQSGEQLAPADKIRRRHAAAFEPIVELSCNRGFVDPLADKRREDHLGAVAFADAIEISAAADGVARQMRLGDDGAHRSRAKIQADKLHEGAHNEPLSTDFTDYTDEKPYGAADKHLQLQMTRDSMPRKGR